MLSQDIWKNTCILIKIASSNVVDYGTFSHEQIVNFMQNLSAQKQNRTKQAPYLSLEFSHLFVCCLCHRLYICLSSI